jgi:hypothetical protein
MKKLMLLICVPVFLLFSCPDGSETDPIDESGVVKKSFWAQSFKDGSFYKIEAGKLIDGKYCTIWVERGAGIDKDGAKSVADEFDTKIYPKMLDNFGVTFTDEEGDFTNIEYADWLGDGDGKLAILLLDIKDGYSASNRAYTAGYFWSGDLYENDPTHAQLKYSNKSDIIFIDTNPGLSENAKNTYATLAHEMQHMMSFATGMGARDEDFDVWIDEGLSSAAEWIYLGDHTSNGRVNSYKTNLSGLINEGNNFFVWDNYDSNNYAILDDYSTVYLFFQWLRLQTNSSIYKDIIASADYDYRAVTTKFNAKASGDYSSWTTLLQTWLAANRINSSGGFYGYRGETTLKDIKAPDAPAGKTSILLYPGEGVYSKTTADPSASQSGNIRYAYLSNTTSENTYNSSGTNTLLTYNVNTNGDSGTESGKTTGVAASVSVAPEGRFIQSNEIIRLDGRDMLRRNGNERNIAGYPRPSIANRVINDDR